MNKLILLFAVLTINNYLFSQSLIIHKNGGSKDTVDVADADSIILAPFKCGVNKVRYSNKIYHTVKIAGHCWLKENLDVGTMIDSLQNPSDNGSIEKWCYGNNPDNCALYGGLYQWNEAMQYSTAGGAKGICPNGWHIPSWGEFLTLQSDVSGDGNSLKAVGQGTGSGIGTNTTGFSALISGYHFDDGTFVYLGMYTNFWSSEKADVDGSYYYRMTLLYDSEVINVGNSYKAYGFSIRCSKNE